MIALILCQTFADRRIIIFIVDPNLTLGVLIKIKNCKLTSLTVSLVDIAFSAIIE